MTPSPEMPRIPKWRMIGTAIAVPLSVLLVWGTLHLADTLGVPVETVQGTVTAKNHYSGATSYTTNIVAGRPFVQSSESPEAFVVQVKVKQESAVGYVTQDQFDRLSEGDLVTVKIRRPRSAKTIEIIEFLK